MKRIVVRQLNWGVDAILSSVYTVLTLHGLPNDDKLVEILTRFGFTIT